MTLQIRTAMANDLPGLLDLYADMDGRPAPSWAQATELYAAIARVPDYTLYLAYQEEMIDPVGTFSLLEVPTFMHTGYYKYAVLDAVTIRAALRGQGLGRDMVRQALQQCQQRGCYKVTLSSNLSRLSAHRFYEKLGFSQHGWSFSLAIATPPVPLNPPH